MRASEVLKLLLYFDVFSHPLKEEEIRQYLGVPEKDIAKLESALQYLKSQGLVNFFEGYYFTGTDRTKVSRRKQANLYAEKRMKTALVFSRIISWFPFVRGVFLSGSISKGVMKGDDDIDFFIVTQPGRLWISRTLLILFKKIFLFNSYRNFCVNYFVDSHNLVVKEQNRYVATEIAFLLPVFNYPLYLQLLKQNSWIKAYYPIFSQSGDLDIEKEPFFKKWVEKAIEWFGDALDDFLFEKSKNYISHKFSAKENPHFERSFLIEKNELRFLPNSQHYVVLKSYKNKVLKVWDLIEKADADYHIQNIKV